MESHREDTHVSTHTREQYSYFSPVLDLNDVILRALPKKPPMLLDRCDEVGLCWRDR